MTYKIFVGVVYSLLLLKACLMIGPSDDSDRYGVVGGESLRSL